MKSIWWRVRGSNSSCHKTVESPFTVLLVSLAQLISALAQSAAICRLMWVRMGNWQLSRSPKLIKSPFIGHIRYKSNCICVQILSHTLDQWPMKVNQTLSALEAATQNSHDSFNDYAHRYINHLFAQKFKSFHLPRPTATLTFRRRPHQTRCPVDPQNSTTQWSAAFQRLSMPDY